MNIRLGVRSKILLAVTVLGCTLLLLGSKTNIRNPQQERTALAALIGLLWAGLDFHGYSHLGILASLSLLNPFYFGKSLLAGVGCGMLILFLRAKGAKPVLGMCGVLLVAFNIYGVKHYDLSHLPLCPRPFYSMNGFLVGLAISVLASFGRERETSGGIRNGDNGLAPETTTKDEIVPYRT
jgi:hypothetical protein